MRKAAAGRMMKDCCDDRLTDCGRFLGSKAMKAHALVAGYHRLAHAFSHKNDLLPGDIHRLPVDSLVQRSVDAAEVAIAASGIRRHHEVLAVQGSQGWRRRRRRTTGHRKLQPLHPERQAAAAARRRQGRRDRDDAAAQQQQAGNKAGGSSRSHGGGELLALLDPPRDVVGSV